MKTQNLLLKYLTQMLINPIIGLLLIVCANKTFGQTGCIDTLSHLMVNNIIENETNGEYFIFEKTFSLKNFKIDTTKLVATREVLRSYYNAKNLSNNEIPESPLYWHQDLLANGITVDSTEAAIIGSLNNELYVDSTLNNLWKKLDYYGARIYYVSKPIFIKYNNQIFAMILMFDYYRREYEGFDNIRIYIKDNNKWSLMDSY